MKRIDLKPRRKKRVSPETKAIRALAANVDKLVQALTPPKAAEPTPVPLPDASRPGACRSCGWMTPPDADGCARCTSQVLRTAPAWLTAEAIRDQIALNPTKEWPQPPKRYSVQDQIGNILTTTPR